MKGGFSFKQIKGYLQDFTRMYHDPETPIPAKLLLGAGIAYLLSPIDLIPDFIPIIGYLDDLIIVPLLLGLALLCVPPHVRARHLGKHREGTAPPEAQAVKPRSTDRERV